MSVALLAAPAMAGFPGDVPDRVQFEVGGMSSMLDTQASAGRTNGGLGATIVFEDFFDIPASETTGFLRGNWRVAGRHYLDFGWFKIDRAGSRILDDDVSFRDYTFLAGSALSGGIDSSFPYASYRYDFLQLDQVKIAGTVGVSYIDLGAWLSADVEYVVGPDVPAEGYKKVEISIGMPVPLIGSQIDWAVSRRNSIVVAGRLIYANFSGLRANVTQNMLHWYFHATKHFAIGAGIDRFNINIPKYEKDDQYATFSYQLSGASIYGKLFF